MSILESIGFEDVPKGVDTMSIRLPYHHIGEAVDNGDVIYTKRGFRYSKPYRNLDARFNNLFWDIRKGAKKKVLSADAQWMRDYGLGDLRDEFNVVAIESNFETTGRKWETGKGKQRSDPAAEYLRLVIEREGFEYAYRFVMDKVPSVIAEFSLQKYLTGDPANLDKNQNYSMGLFEIINKMKAILVWFVESKFRYNDGAFTGWPLLRRLDLMADLELDREREMNLFLKEMAHTEFNDYVQTSYVGGYTVKFMPSIRSETLRKWDFFRDGEFKIPTTGPKAHKLPHLQYYNKTQELWNKGKGVKIDGIVLRGEQQYHSGNDIFTWDPLLHQVKKAVGGFMHRLPSSRSEMIEAIACPEIQVPYENIDTAIVPLYAKYDLIARARAGEREAKGRVRKDNPSLRDRICEFLEVHKKSTSAQIRAALGMSQRLLYYHLQLLRHQGVVELRGRRYWGLTQAQLYKLNRVRN